MNKTINTKYNFPLNAYPILKMQELFPITNDVVILVSGIPISDEYAHYLEDHINEMCSHFNKDLVLGVDIHFEPVDEDEDYDDEYEDEEDDDTLEFDDEQDLFEYLRAGNVGYNVEDFPDQYTESFSDNGFMYNFSKIFPEYDNSDTPFYPLYNSEYGDRGIIFDENISNELNQNIDSEGTNWMFTFSFRHPISLTAEVSNPKIISDETKEFGDKMIYSLMDAMHNGIVNMTQTESMQLIIGTMRDVAVSHGRVPFVGTVGFNLYLPNLNDDLKYSYVIWTQSLYNMLLEDYVEYESKITPPITFGADDKFYFKQTDFLGQYYMPNGIDIRKEEKKNGRRKESKKNVNGKTKKPNCKKENNKKQSP